MPIYQNYNQLTSNPISTLIVLGLLTYCSAKTDTEFIKTSCDALALSSYATKIQDSPKLLAITAVSVSASTFITKLAKTQGLNLREAVAVRDCVEELSDSVDEIRRSISEMENGNGKSFELRMDDVKTWVSAALTVEDTYMDGFSGSGNVKATVRSHSLNVAHMTSNALALVNSYASPYITSWLFNSIPLDSLAILYATVSVCMLIFSKFFVYIILLWVQ